MERDEKRRREPAKRQNLASIQSEVNDMENKMKRKKEEGYEASSSSERNNKYLELGVFDFPWLEESMISKSAAEEWVLEDWLRFPAHDICPTEFPGHWTCAIPPESTTPIHFPSEEFEENAWSSLEMDNPVLAEETDA